MKELEAVTVRLASDPDFRAQFGEDPESALTMYRLTDSERRLLVQFGSLLAMSPQALRARWLPDMFTEGPVWWDSVLAPQTSSV